MVQATSNIDSQFSIRQLAKEFEVTTRTLRFYEEKGLLQPTRSGSTRSYSNADRARLKLILRGKRLGLTLEESSDIIAMYQPKGSNRDQLIALLDKISEKKQQLLIQQQALDTMMQDLETWERKYKAELAEQSTLHAQGPVTTETNISSHALSTDRKPHQSEGAK